MAQANSFVVSQFTNPSKEIVFRVSGWLDGRRVRKNFPTRAEAEAERQVLEIQRLQADSGLRPILTRLNEDQVQESEAAFRKLKGTSKSLLFYLDYALANYREPACSRSSENPSDSRSGCIYERKTSMLAGARSQPSPAMLRTNRQRHIGTKSYPADSLKDFLRMRQRPVLSQPCAPGSTSGGPCFFIR